MAFDIKVKREKWKSGYTNVARDSKGHFIKTQKWSQKNTVNNFIESLAVDTIRFKEDEYTIAQPSLRAYEERPAIKSFKLVRKPVALPKKIIPLDAEWKTFFRWYVEYYDNYEDYRDKAYPRKFNNNSDNVQMLVYHKGKVSLEELKQQVLSMVLPSTERVYGLKFRYHYFQSFYDGKDWRIDSDTEEWQ